MCILSLCCVIENDTITQLEIIYHTLLIYYFSHFHFLKITEAKSDMEAKFNQEENRKKK